MSEQRGKVGGRGGGGGNKKKRRKAAARGETNSGRTASQSGPPQPGSSPLTAIVRAPLQALLQSISRLNQQVRVFHQGSPCKAVDVTSPLPPVEVFQKAARQLSEQSANLAVLFSCVPPLPSSMECTAYACDVERAAASLAASYNHIPPIYGLALHKEVERCVLSIMRELESVVSTVISTGTIKVPQTLRDSGTTLWDLCHKAEKLPRDNKAAVVKETLSQLHLVRDGCNEAELVEAVQGKGEGLGGMASGEVGALCEGVQEVKLGGGRRVEGPREWNARERQLAQSCVGLIKLCSEVTSELCCVLVRGGRCGVMEGQARELDQTLFLVLELSPLVDELLGELPAPLLWPDCREAGERLAHSLMRILHTVSSFHICVASAKWTSLYWQYTTEIAALAARISACGTPTAHTSP